MPRHERPHWGFVEKLEAEAGDVAEQFGPQVQAHRLRHPIRQVGHPILDSGLHKQQRHNGQEHHQKRLVIPRSHGPIHGIPNQSWPHPDNARQEKHQCTRQHESLAVRRYLLQNQTDQTSVKYFARGARGILLLRF